MAKTTQHNYAAKLKAAILNAAITGKLTGGTTGWKTVKLGEIGKWKAGATPLRGNSSYYEGGNIPWLKTGDLNDGIVVEVSEYITQKAVEETSVVLNPIGSVLIAMYGATIGKVGILGIEATTNQACCACQVNEKIVLNKYLFYFLLSRREAFKKAGMGGAQPNISKDKIVNTDFPLPPLAVQKEIVRKVEELMGLVEVVRKGGAKIRELGAKARAKILDRAIHGKLVAQDPADPPPSAPAATTTPPYPIPPNWKWVTLGEMADVQLGKMLDKAKTNGKEYRYLANISVRWGSFDLENLKTTFFTEREVEKFALQKGDILMCEGGEPGRCAIWKEKDSGIKYQKALHRIRLVGDLPEYVCIYFEAVHDSQLFVNRLTGSTIKHLPRERLIEMLIPLPPVAEQRRIVAKVEALLAVVETLTTPR